jgi:hypothetical protein
MDITEEEANGTKFEFNDKTKIWDEFFHTDPSKTKGFVGKGGFSGTAINPTYVKERLTQRFGPVGLGWGYKVIDEEIIKGHKVGDNQYQVHKVLIEFWYRFGGMRSEPMQAFGQTTICGENKRGWFTDEEAPKKSLTDALMKAVSDLGMCADIHAGLYDDNKYIAEVKQMFSGKEKETPTPTNGKPKRRKTWTEEGKDWPDKKSIVHEAEPEAEPEKPSESIFKTISVKQGKLVYALMMGAGFDKYSVGVYLKQEFQVERCEQIPRESFEGFHSELKAGNITPANIDKSQEEDVPF